MLKWLFTAVTVAVAALAIPALAQPSPPAALESDANLVGFAVYSSDGQKLGSVTKVGMVGDQRAVQAMLDDLGDGSSDVVIPQALFAQKPDRIELTMTAAEVRDTLSQQKQRQQ